MGDFSVFQVVGLVVLVLQPLNIIKKLAFPSFEQELDTLVINFQEQKSEKNGVAKTPT